MSSNAEDAKYHAKQAVSSGTAALHDKWTDAKEAIQDKFQDAKEDAKEKYYENKGYLEGRYDAARARTEEDARMRTDEHAVEHHKGIFERAKDYVHDGVEKTKELAHQATEKTKEMFGGHHESHHEVREVRADPQEHLQRDVQRDFDGLKRDFDGLKEHGKKDWEGAKESARDSAAYSRVHVDEVPNRLAEKAAATVHDPFAHRLEKALDCDYPQVSPMASPRADNEY